MSTSRHGPYFNAGPTHWPYLVNGFAFLINLRIVKLFVNPPKPIHKSLIDVVNFADYELFWNNFKLTDYQPTHIF